MSTDSPSDSHQQLSGEFVAADPERYDDVERKQALINEWLRSRQYEGLVLQTPANFSWFTSGAPCPAFSAGEPTAALFITPESRVVVSNNVDSRALFEIQLAGLGFLMKERPWHEPRSVLLDDLCRGRRVACDAALQGAKDESTRIASLRFPLERVECQRLRFLGRALAHAVEATGRNLKPGLTEAEIAGEMSHRLVKRGIIPQRLQVAADGRLRHYRHWTFSDTPLRHWVVLSAIGSYQGLHASATRVVCFGQPSDELAQSFQQAVLLIATGMHFSQAGSILASVWEKVRRIYEKTGAPLEWQLCDQGTVMGYQVCETPLVPRSDYTLSPRTAVWWRPSAGPVQVGETILVGEQGYEWLTSADQWPLLQISVRGHLIPLPDMLIREVPK